MRYLTGILLILFSATLHAQNAPDGNYADNVQSVQLTVAGKPLLYPVVMLGETGKLRLDFDDLDNKIKTYYYTFVHCNADWQPSSLFPSAYI